MTHSCNTSSAGVCVSVRGSTVSALIFFLKHIQPNYTITSNPPFFLFEAGFMKVKAEENMTDVMKCVMIIVYLFVFFYGAPSAIV